MASDTEGLIETWGRRYPSKIDPVHVWDDVISNRSFFLKRLSSYLTAAGSGANALPLTGEHKTRLSALHQKVTSANVKGYLRAATTLARTGNFLVAKHYIGKAGEESKGLHPLRLL